MGPLSNKEHKLFKAYLLTALMLLVLGLSWGIIGSLQYISPGLLKQHFSFEKIRPLHVSSVLFWIIIASVGMVLTYLPSVTGKKLYSFKLAYIHLLVFIISTLGIYFAYISGNFGGREYWEFPPFFAVLIIAGWILFLINFISSLSSFRNQPVYIWMWMTGIIFFLFTYLESYLWVIPYFRKNLIGDLLIQWKSNGSMVGSWNMLIYGSSIILMEKISGNKETGQSSIAFILYFTGLFNLMFNWGHHIYTLPTAPYVQYISYAVSMTELFIIGRIIFNWKKTLDTAQKNLHILSYRLLLSSDIWVFLTLALAILMSIPGINVYTHGTHITVAHTMGATIGINSFILLATITDNTEDNCSNLLHYHKIINKGIWISNISLLVFWCSLIGAGIKKVIWQTAEVQNSFSMMMQELKPYFIVFMAAGISLAIGLFCIIFPLMKMKISCIFKK